ncbi:uncharacterized protein LOC117792733 [Drosophila innubila]|uniref:uncharacterized protein LOC117792733 n=1 Tax=Drosophila innubila TaxID=198719 RepID=UPI00148D0EDD|nr:uncharacterized protein LOC117792733 [Drosophila innubila]
MYNREYSYCGLAFLLIVTFFGCGTAWKPIASSGLPITSYSLKQSHPGEASSSHELATSYSQFGSNKDNDHDHDNDDEDDLVLPHSTVNAVETGSISHHPIILNDDQENHYESYILKDDVIKASSLSLPRTPLYVSSSSSSSSSSLSASLSSDRCSVKKFAFNQDGAVEYNNELPELDQFTLCFWMRFTNHTGDHVMLTYEAEKEQREIQIWVANAQNSSFLSMAIKGQQMYRLNYPLKMRQWHHMCSSWNGKTGEWQVWLKAERIGRGFHNSLVGHKIPAKGKLRSGGSSITGEVSHGLHFEVTLVQIYRVALSAGKAHRDHKHHHVHHFDHEGQEVSSTARAPPMINRPQPMHMLLASGQIPSRVRINLANSVPSQESQQQGPSAITVNTNFVNGQINTGSRLVAQQLLNYSPLPPSRAVGGILSTPTTVTANEAGRFQMLSNSANVQFIDETETHIQFKRNSQKNQESGNVAKKLQKRGIVLLDDGSLVDDGLDSDNSEIYSKYNGLADFGGQQFKHDLTLRMTLEEEISTHDREPAEEEVKAVMAICSNCDPEPFQGAIVFAWKDISEQMNNTLKGLSVGTCGNF